MGPGMPSRSTCCARTDVAPAPAQRLRTLQGRPSVHRGVETRRSNAAISTDLRDQYLGLARLVSRKHDRPVTLATVPEEQWAYLASFGFDAVWFMGVGSGVPRASPSRIRTPGCSKTSGGRFPISGRKTTSALRIAFETTSLTNTSEGGAVSRLPGAALASRGLAPILDFRPNHVAPDHPWVTQHPEYFVQGNAYDARHDPASFVELGDKVFARGRDPFFPAWPDVLQLNAFQAGLRQAVARDSFGYRRPVRRRALRHGHAAASRGLRAHVGPALPARGPASCPSTNRIWAEEAMAAVSRRREPDFVFVAEAYWDLEWTLQQQGFDYSLRQAPVPSSAQPRLRRERARSSVGGHPPFQGTVRSIPRESRRAAGRRGIFSREGARRRRDRRDGSGRTTLSRRAIRGKKGQAAGLLEPPSCRGRRPGPPPLLPHAPADRDVQGVAAWRLAALRLKRLAWTIPATRISWHGAGGARPSAWSSS